eukprot:c34346_g1_i1 orf=3-203(-)
MYLVMRRVVRVPSWVATSGIGFSLDLLPIYIPGRKIVDHRYVVAYSSKFTSSTDKILNINIFKSFKS